MRPVVAIKCRSRICNPSLLSLLLRRVLTSPCPPTSLTLRHPPTPIPSPSRGHALFARHGLTASFLWWHVTTVAAHPLEKSASGSSLLLTSKYLYPTSLVFVLALHPRTSPLVRLALEYLQHPFFQAVVVCSCPQCHSNLLPMWRRQSCLLSIPLRYRTWKPR